MVKSNCHTHTNYCDGKNSAKEMVEAAIEKGFVSLGFSSHSPMLDKNDWTMKADDVSNYIKEIRALKNEYANKIDILCGIEVDSYFSGINLDEFDYTIGSVHQLRGQKKIYDVDYTTKHLTEAVDSLFNGNWLEMSDYYYKSLADFICDNSFQVVGHIDLITKFNEKDKYIDESDPHYQKSALNAVDRILEKQKNILFEVNTGAMYRCGNSKPYPAPFIMKHLFEKRARITITSDAHCCDALDFAFEEAKEYCKSFGFTKSCILTKKGIKEIEL